MSHSTERNLATGFGLALVVLVINAVLSLLNVQSLVSSGDWVIHTREVLGIVETVVGNLRETQVRDRNFIITGSNDEAQLRSDASQRLQSNLDLLKRLTSDNPAQVERIALVQSRVDGFLDFLSVQSELRRKQGFAAAQASLATDAENRQFDQVLQSLAEVKDAENLLLAKRTSTLMAGVWWAFATTTIATVLALGMLGTSFILIRRDVRERRSSARLASLAAHVGTAIIQGDGLDDILRRCCEGLVTNLDGAFARIWTLSDDGTTLILRASAGMYTHIDGPHARVPVGKYKIGMIAEQRKEHLSNDVPNDPRVGDHEWARREGMVAFAGYPLMIEDRLVGVMAMFARHTLSESALRAMGTMAYGIALSIDRKQAEAELRESEEQVRLLLESSGEGIYGVDTKGCCTFCNPAGMRMLGYDDPTQLLDKNMHELVHHTRPDGRPFPQEECQIFRAIHSGEGTHSDDEIFWRRDGTAFPVDYQSRPIYRGDQRLGAVVTFADITNRRRVEETVRLRDRSLAAISQGLFITDPLRSDEPIVYVNAAFEAMTGYSQAEVAGRHIGILKGAETAPEALDELKGALASRRNCTVELVLHRKDETPYWASLSISVVQDGSGRATHFVGVMTDISEHKRAEEELRAAKEAAEAASRSKSTFLANMSHELRTPLNAIIGYSEMLQEENQGEGNEELVDDLQRIHGAGKHLLGLINDILDLSKIEAGKLDLYLETFSVPEMIRGVVGTIRPLIEKNGNTLEVICRDEIGSMRADLTKVRQALLNVLSNASKFTEKGTVTLTVTRHQADERDWLSIEVRDSGIGMKPEQMGRLFQPFMQADNSTTRKYGGTGLGLMITRRFCQMMGGDIAVKSTEGIGSTFTISLPIDVPELATQPSEQDLSVYNSHLDSGRLVLVIDDDPTVSNLMRRTLEKDGFRVHHAPGGERGLILARELRPAVITLDVMMPGMDGWTVLSALKAESDLADIPVVMVTIVDDKNLGYALGASDYLTKPIDRKRLAETLKRYRRDETGRTALVVDDDLVTRDLVRQILTKDGWNVIEAENGRLGLERMKDSPPDVILLDLMMPEMDGFVFAKEVRHVEEWRSIPILVLTAKDLTEEDRERLNGDIRAILQKSVYTREELLQEIRREVADSIRIREGSRLLPDPAQA